VHKRRSIARALLASLLLHVVFLAATWDLNFLSPKTPEPEQESRAVTMEFVMLPESDAEDMAGRPREFTSVPESHAVDEPVENPDFLAMVDSRAADMIESGENQEVPGAQEESEVTQVLIRRDDAGGAPLPAPVLPVLRSGEQQEEGDRSGSDAASESQPRGTELSGEEDGQEPRGEIDGQGNGEETRESSSASSGDIVELVPLVQPSALLREGRGVPGDPGFTYDQQASGTAGNMVQFGEFRLNTLAWEFAPWLEEFKRDFLPNWIPPYAYALGVVEGKTVVRLEIDMDGSLSNLEVLEENGHDSLHKASQAALRATAPFAVLPDDFPEEKLVLELGLHYPGRQLSESSRQLPTGGERPEDRRRTRRSP